MAASSEAQGSAPSVSLWNDPKKRALIYQAIVMIALIIVAAYIIKNTAENLEKRGIAVFRDIEREAAIKPLQNYLRAGGAIYNGGGK